MRVDARRSRIGLAACRASRLPAFHKVPCGRFVGRRRSRPNWAVLERSLHSWQIPKTMSAIKGFSLYWQSANGLIAMATPESSECSVWLRAASRASGDASLWAPTPRRCEGAGVMQEMGLVGRFRVAARLPGGEAASLCWELMAQAGQAGRSCSPVFVGCGC